MAGVILLCTGVIYTLIGIKNSILHNAFSVAYVVGLGITVLVVYVMVIPVSNGSQGAYVAAAVLPAVFVGVLTSWFFKEITECLACALGGFCFSMWLLCLHDGGLLSGVSKVIFIVVLSLAGFATYFTRWTRDWALMITISFNGATAVVLGIDCFSLAGLKEFWAYVWDLNDNLFPLGAETYPMTKGIRVELAAIIVICGIGIISQKRLWNVIKDRRAKRAEELAEMQRARDEEEANIGKKIESQNARERRAWERVHGDYVPGGSDRDSGFARDSESEKGVGYSHGTATPLSQVMQVAEMPGSEVPPAVPPKTVPQGLMVSEKENAAMVTVRVAPDERPAGPDGADGTASRTGETRQAMGAVQTPREVSPVPEVVPLPFRFPPTEESMAKDKEDRSTIATFADEDEDQADVGNKRSSFAKRVSQSSVSLMRKVSQRTSMSLRKDNGLGEDEMVVLRRPRDDDAGSIAATINTESDSGAGTVQGKSRHSIEINAQLNEERETDTKRMPASASQQGAGAEDTANPASTTQAAAGDIPAPSSAGDADGLITADTTRVEEETANADSVAKEDGASKGQDQAGLEPTQLPAVPSEKAKSTASVDSTPVNLTQKHLPPSFSNVALHYRTNEWAKHLSHAEAPEPETMPIVDYPEDDLQRQEVPAPLNVEELQQTALSATPAPAAVRTSVAASTSAPTSSRPVSTVIPNRGHSRNDSYQSNQRATNKTQFQSIAEEGAQVAPQAPSTKSGSSGKRSSVASVAFERPPPPPGVQSYDSPQSLLAQRSVTLRNKTYGILTGGHVTPDLSAAAHRAASESGSAHNYAAYSPQISPESLDDVPLSQRKELIRRQSSLGTARSSMDSSLAAELFMPGMSAENVAFDSHQPMRYSSVPSQEARDARMASFRNSVRADLRAGMAVSPAAANGRDMALVGMYRSSSSSNLLNQPAAREVDMQRNIDLQRSFMLSQKEADAKRREKERLEKEKTDLAFTRSMQSGEMFELHRDMMRKMQKRANGA